MHRDVKPSNVWLTSAGTAKLDLKSELDKAQASNDRARALRLRQEIEFIAAELGAAFGLGGRARKTADAAERARKAVSGRIHETIARIRKEQPTLAFHLQNAIRLGTFLSYQPERPTRWDL